METISLWAEGIIIAIIIGTVIQIILPENKNKKYIKVVIGIYVLFCIIKPVVGGTINFDEYDINKYITVNQTSDTKENDFDTSVKRMFENKIKANIKTYLNDKGYDSDNISIETDNDYNVTSVKISNISQYQKNSIMVNKIDISIKDKPVEGIAFGKKLELKKFIAEMYNIKEEKIVIE